jgi:hypothetical protein
MERKTIRPHFWKDALWVYPALMLILGAGFSVFMWRLCGGKPEWLGLSVIMNALILPIFFLLWLDNISNRAIFEENSVIFKGFLHKQTIDYKNILSISFTNLSNATLTYFNPKLGKNQSSDLFIWNYSINILIDEIKKRTGIMVNGYPDTVNRRNLRGKLWFLLIMLLTIVIIIAAMWNVPETKLINRTTSTSTSDTAE